MPQSTYPYLVANENPDKEHDAFLVSLLRGMKRWPSLLIIRQEFSLIILQLLGYDLTVLCSVFLSVYSTEKIIRNWQATIPYIQSHCFSSISVGLIIWYSELSAKHNHKAREKVENTDSCSQHQLVCALIR